MHWKGRGVSLAPHCPLHRRGHKFAVLADVSLDWVNENHRAVQRAQVPLDHADNQKHLGLPADCLNARDGVGIRDLDRGVVVPEEFVQTLRCASTESGAEGAVLWISANATVNY